MYLVIVALTPVDRRDVQEDTAMIALSSILPTGAPNFDPNMLFGIAAIASAVIPPLAMVAIAYLRGVRR